MRVFMQSGILCSLALLLASCADKPKKAEVQKKDDGAVAIRLLDVDGITYDAAKGGALPARITNAEDLAKTFPDKESRAWLAERVDLSKEDLLLFAWVGCSGDEFNAELEKLQNVTIISFTLKGGITSDIQAQLRLFAITKGANYRFQKTY